MRTEPVPPEKRPPTDSEIERGLAHQVRVMALAVLRLGRRLPGVEHPSPQLMERLINMAADITADAAKVVRVADRFHLLDDVDSDETREARHMVETVTAMNRQLRRVHERR